MSLTFLCAIRYFHMVTAYLFLFSSPCQRAEDYSYFLIFTPSLPLFHLLLSVQYYEIFTIFLSPSSLSSLFVPLPLSLSARFSLIEVPCLSLCTPSHSYLPTFLNLFPRFTFSAFYCLPHASSFCFVVLFIDVLFTASVSPPMGRLHTLFSTYHASRVNVLFGCF